MSSTTAATSTSDHLAKFGLTRNPDGSFTRTPGLIPSTPASSDPPVSTKDVPINPLTNTWARLYLPRPPPPTKLPLIVFYHGGGFIIASAASTIFQKFCSNIALQTPAILVSVDYRNAPEHRLPAAYDDCLEALRWISASPDEWLADHADLSNCFIMGNSAGGNIAYHVGLRVVNPNQAWDGPKAMPLEIRGLILHQPLFGGVERTASEMRLADDEVIPLHVTDAGWEMALPAGGDRDHEYCNPLRNVPEELVGRMREEGWKVLVTGYEGDPLVDRQIGLAKMLEDNGVDVAQHFGSGASHGIEFYDDSYADIFYDVLKNFLSSF